MEEFRPYVQVKEYQELRPGDIIRAEGRFYIIVEVRRGRRAYAYTATGEDDLTELTGAMTDRFVHIDKFGVDEVSGDWTVKLTFQGTDVTGKQFGHVWTLENAHPERSPNELDVVSFTDRDILHATVTRVAAGTLIVYYSYEEYTLQVVKGAIPDRYKIVTRYGWSRLITSEEDEKLGITTALRA